MTVNVGKWLTIETDGKGGGRLVKGMEEVLGREEIEEYEEGCVDALESLFLDLACNGVDVSAPVFVNALETTLDAIGNNL